MFTRVGLESLALDITPLSGGRRVAKLSLINFPNDLMYDSSLLLNKKINKSSSGRLVMWRGNLENKAFLSLELFLHFKMK